jgi:hypothetical protein
VTPEFALDQALQLQPETRNVFVIGGTSRFDRQIQAVARREVAAGCQAARGP